MKCCEYVNWFWINRVLFIWRSPIGETATNLPWLLGWHNKQSQSILAFQRAKVSTDRVSVIAIFVNNTSTCLAIKPQNIPWPPIFAFYFFVGVIMSATSLLLSQLVKVNKYYNKNRDNIVVVTCFANDTFNLKFMIRVFYHCTTGHNQGIVHY